MAPPKRTKVERIRDRSLIAELTLKGHTQSQISERLGLSQSQVSRDLSKIKETWRQESVRDYDVCVEQELLRLSLLERTYWQAWERSLQPKESTSSEKKGDEVKVGRRTEYREGNPQFLQGIHSCIERRVKLLGLEAPAKSEVISSISMNQNYTNMSLDEINNLYAAKLQNASQN